MKHNNPNNEMYIPLVFTERQVQNMIKKELGQQFVCLAKKPYGYCYVSAHWQNILTKKIVNVFTDDLRDDKLRLYIRTARHEKDFTGGRNVMTPLALLKEYALELTKAESISHKDTACM